MPKRKSRNKMSNKLDITKPITLEMLGSDDDPCFGKHYAPGESACQRCGDSELCAIAMAQFNHLKRGKVEGEQKFKDMEEKDIKPTIDKKEARRGIKKRIREIIRKAGSTGVNRDAIIIDAHASYNKDGFTQKAIGNILDKMITKSDHIIKSENKYKWKQ